MRGLGGSLEGGAICVDKNRLWVSDKATKQVRWSQSLATPWPDSVVNSMLPQVKAKKDRVKFTCSISKLKGLSERAKLLMSGDEYGKIYVERSSAKAGEGDLFIEGLFSRGSFTGKVTVSGTSKSDPVGISPQRLGSVLEAVGASSDAFDAGDNVEISFGASGGGSDPIVLTSNGIDALLMPVILP